MKEILLKHIPKKKFYRFFILFLILWSGWLYRQLVFDFSDWYSKEQLEDFYSKERVIFEYDLPYKETLFLKLKTKAEIPVQTIAFNDNLIKSLHPRLRGLIYTYSICVPEEFTIAGYNKLEVYFMKPASLKRLARLHRQGWKIYTNLYNYRKKFSSNLIALFPDSHVFKLENSVLKLLFACFIFALVLALLKRRLMILLNEPTEQIYKYLAILIILPNIVLTLIYFALLFYGYRIAMDANYLFACFVFPVIIEISLFIGIAFFKLIKLIFTSFLKSLVLILKFSFTNRGKAGTELRELVNINILRDEFKKAILTAFPPVFVKIFRKFSPWIKRGDFSDKCIVLFISLVIMNVFISGLHLGLIVKLIGNLAYCLLVTAAAIKLIKLRGGIRHLG